VVDHQENRAKRPLSEMERYTDDGSRRLCLPFNADIAMIGGLLIWMVPTAGGFQPSTHKPTLTGKSVPLA